MARAFTDNPGKRAVRDSWNAPLLRHLHQQYGVRYRYLGLPGPDLIDVRAWQDMIDEVIVFQTPDKDGQRTAYKALTVNMRKFGIRGTPFCGSFEEVVLWRMDLEGRKYAQNNIITLYNLDFCNEICSRVETREHGNQCWRFEAIRQVLCDQHECYQRDRNPRHFVLMLTLRNQITPANVSKYLPPESMQDETKAFYARCLGENPFPSHRQEPLIGSHSWALKTLLYTTLHGHFVTHNLSALFFPQVHYVGTPAPTNEGLIDSPMIHCLVLCRFGDQAISELWPHQYLPKPSVKAQEILGQGVLSWNHQTGENAAANGTPDVIRWLAEHGNSILDGI